jgi:hypothetical protein
MTVAVYTALNDGSHLLDGGRAQNHLTHGLGMTAISPAKVPELDAAFSQWREQHADCITLHPGGPMVLLSPGWFK